MRFQVFNVVPKIPEPLSRLRELAFNLLWSWDENLRDVFLRIDRELFERVGQDPVQLLAQVPQERLEYLTVEDGFLTLYRNTLNHFQAGFDIFPRDLMARYFSDYAQEVGLGFDQFLALGHPAQGSDDSFNMAGLAIRTSAHVNAVSELHGKVSRSILSAYAPNVPEPEVPIGHVTNGAHTRSCVSREVGLLFDRYLGGDWWKGAGDPDTWQNIDSIPDEELWASHSRQRERLVSFTRRRLSEQVARRGGTPRDLEKARAVLSTRALAIGRGEDYDDDAYQDQVESDSLYNLLEKEVIPLFYERGTDGMPKGWIARMKASMRILTPIFSTNRMLAEYVERYYLPAAAPGPRTSRTGRSACGPPGAT